MFREGRGSIFSSPARALVNPVNIRGVMGAGLAEQFKKRYPRHYDNYRAACRRGSLMTGTVLSFSERGKIIICLPTKVYWREKSRLSVVRAGARALAAEMERLEIESVAIPALGCGLGQLSWRSVQPMLREELAEAAQSADIYLYAPDAERPKAADRRPEKPLESAVRRMRQGRLR